MTVRLSLFLLTFPIYALATARLVRLLGKDVILHRPRAALQAWLEERKRYQLLYLTGCPWCLSVWISLPVFVCSYHLGIHPVVPIIASALAASHVTGLLSSREGRTAGQGDEGA